MPRGVGLSASFVTPDNAEPGKARCSEHGFASDDLNEVRRAVLSAVVERTVEESDGEPNEIALAADQAIRSHAAGFDKKPGEKREFAAFPKGVVHFARYGAPEEEPGFAERAADTVGKAAASPWNNLPESVESMPESIEATINRVQQNSGRERRRETRLTDSAAAVREFLPHNRLALRVRDNLY